MRTAMASLRTAIFTMVLMFCVSPNAKAQWVVLNLHPAGATNSEAAGVSGAQQAGHANNGLVAEVWQGSAPSAVALNSTAGVSARADCTTGTQQGGLTTTPANNSHAALWSGSRQTLVDLHPSDPGIQHSRILGANGSSQVGLYAVSGGGATFAGGKACMWSGSSNTFVNLNPPEIGSSEARGVFGNQQVGATFDTGLGLACMWTGTAESFLSLNPPEALFSAAVCSDGTHQYGVIGLLEPPGLFPVRWSGTAESWVNLGVPDEVLYWGEVHATHGGYQAGYITDTDGVSNSKACIWHDAPGTYFDLHQFVPAVFTASNALGIWQHADSETLYVVGYGENGAGPHREALMWVNGPGVNLITSPFAPTDCSSSAGQPMNFGVRVLNAGPVTADAVTLTVDLPPATIAAYTTATPAPTSVTATQLTFDLGSIAGAGAFTDVSITLTAVNSGATATITAAATTAAEVDPTNNTASASTWIQPASPATAAAKGILSNIATQTNSLIPGGSGARYTTINKPVASPSGNWWATRAVSNLPAATDTMLIRSQTNGTPTIALQEGVTNTAAGLMEGIDTGIEVNDAGLVGFGGDGNGATATDRFVGTTDGTSVTLLAREGSAIPAMAGINYGSSVGGSVNLFNNGQVGFFTTTTPANSNAYLSNNGNTIIVRMNVTIPGGASVPIDTLLNASTGVTGLFFDATGTHNIYQADINTGSANDDQVIVADGSIVLREGVTILGAFTTTPNSANKIITMGGSGVWFVRGSNTLATEDWVVRGSGSTIAHLYVPGDPIFTGSTELWQVDASTATPFFANAADGSGNYVVGGNSTNADSFANAVLVYNDQIVVGRENDPMDLDGNGIFDDGVYIRSFDADAIAFVQGGLLASVTLRDEDAALCHTNDVSRGQALIRIPLPAFGDLNCDGGFNNLDVEPFVTAVVDSAAYSAMFPNCNILNADMNHDGFVNGLDVNAFTNCLLGGPCP